MRSPFDDAGPGEQSHVVLTNTAGQQCLWPAFAPVPAGWSVTVPPTDHRNCLAHVGQDSAGSHSPVTAPSGDPQ
ncbi:MbtH family NRPS accessory protein [Streptomyces sparsus]